MQTSSLPRSKSVPKSNKPADERKTKPASAKRARMPRRCDYSKNFERAWARYLTSGRVDMTAVKLVMSLIINADASLPEEYKDHELSGKWAGYRDCHVRGDHLLIYKISEDGKSVIFAEMGTHAELFR